MEKKIAVIRIRGKTGVKEGISLTMDLLGISVKHRMVILPGTPDYLGMVKKAKDYVTYGEISDETLKLVAQKKKNLAKEKDGKKPKVQIYALNPPVGGFERKGIKAPFSKKGALGYRADKINDLIKKMI